MIKYQAAFIIIGFIFLSCISKKSTLKDNLSLDNFLETRGFHRIQLQKNSVGQFLLTLYYDNNPFKVILDTGASSTVLDIDVFKSSNIPLEQADFAGGGVGTSQASVYLLPQKDIKIGSIITNIQVYAMDISNVNQSLASRSIHKIDGIIGSDLLNQTNAIIDYKNNYLYLLKK